MKKPIDVDKLKRAIARKQATIDKNSKALKKAPKRLLVGWDDSSGTYPEQDGKSVAYIAYIHEFGVPESNIVSKNMTSKTVFLHQKEWTKLYAKLVHEQMRNNKIPDYYDIIEQVGRQIKADLRSYLYQIDLIDTTRLANSIIIKYRRNN